MTDAPLATVIIPASNEAGYIDTCLAAVLATDGATPFETIVVANGCTDDTAEVARQAAERLSRPDRPVRVLETPEGGKPAALQRGDAAAQAPVRIYLDADVMVEPGLIPALIDALAGGDARYASGVPVVAPARSALTRTYARFWQRLPFVTTGVPGFGLFAVNAAGRARWGAWPGIISDDTYARLNFAPSERVQVPHRYGWPMVEGLGPLIRVRRRQDRGVREIAALYPELLRNGDQVPGATLQKALAALRDPGGFAVYALVALCVRLPMPGSGGWARGR